VVRRLHRYVDPGPGEDHCLDDEIDLDPAHHAFPDQLRITRLEGRAQEAEVEAQLNEGGRHEDGGGKG
jgi:hypothetical protein